MSRLTKLITIPGARDPDTPGQRDNGKTFLLTEMPARQAEAWADRAFLALAASAFDIPKDIDVRGGMASIYQLALLVGHMRFPELRPLMDELMSCIKIVPEPRNPMSARALIDVGDVNDDIEDATTRIFLRNEVISLHINFSLAARIFNLIGAASTITELSLETPQTSPKRSRRLSRAA